MTVTTYEPSPCQLVTTAELRDMRWQIAGLHEALQCMLFWHAVAMRDRQTRLVEAGRRVLVDDECHAGPVA